MPQIGTESVRRQSFLAKTTREQFQARAVDSIMINDVSDTAFWVASYRAAETERPDGLFRDPLAGRLSGERGREIARTMPNTRMTEWTVVLRTVIIDDFIRRAVAAGVDTIVNLGAGLDTRPYRLEVPSTVRWIEVDYAHVIDFKERELANETPRVQLERAKIDLSDRARRQEFLATVNQSAKRILVLTEGVVPYLTVEQTATLADDLRAMSHVDSWVVDYLSAEAMKMLAKSGMQERLGNAPFRFFPADWFAFFKEHNWTLKDMRYFTDEGDKHGRMLPIPWIYRLLMKFMSEERKQAGRTWAGYALLQPTRNG